MSASWACRAGPLTNQVIVSASRALGWLLLGAFRAVMSSWAILALFFITVPVLTVRTFFVMFHRLDLDSLGEN